MSTAYGQDKRQLSVSSVLGDNVLLLQSFSGHEAISHLFNFQLEVLSENETIAATDLVGTSITWAVLEGDQDPRYFNGIVNRMVAGGASQRNMRIYRLEVVPKLWFLTRATNCKIYQNKSVMDIVKSVLGDFGVTNLQDNTTATYAPRDYCVQYRETAFNFISRLMEQEGIFYFFQHAKDKHTLVLADAKSAFQDVAENSVSYMASTKGPNMIDHWEHQYEYRSGVWTMTDYNFETPSTSLLSSTNTLLTLQGIAGYELFDYPGDFMKKADGTAEVKVRMEEEEAPYDVVVGSSECNTFTPGGKFKLEDHEISAEVGKYVITSVQHAGHETGYGNTADEADYQNSFTCIPDSVIYRPQRVTPRPIVQGPQTAVVVGKSGEEIWVDKYGRVKVQFFWDRLGTKDENSSCWVRVAQHWAGKNWGFIVNPRIGQEVIVDFIEGDPDRPIITGRVYNAEMMPPYTLPDNMTQTGIKTRSSKGGGDDDFNELRFEDKKSSEEIYFHAQKDFNRVVENNDTLKVGSSDSNTCPDGSQTVEIYKDRTTTLATGNETVTVKKGDRTETISEGNESVTVTKGTRTVTVSGTDTHEVQKGDRVVTIDKGADKLTVTTGDQTIAISAGSSSMKAGQAITLEGTTTVTLKVGPCSIELSMSGIKIAGPMVTIAGDAMVKIN